MSISVLVYQVQLVNALLNKRIFEQQFSKKEIRQMVKEVKETSQSLFKVHYQYRRVNDGIIGVRKMCHDTTQSVPYSVPCTGHSCL